MGISTDLGYAVLHYLLGSEIRLVTNKEFVDAFRGTPSSTGEVIVEVLCVARASVSGTFIAATAVSESHFRARRTT